MIDLLAMQKQFIHAHLGPGDIAADFTMGNGHDTLFLCQTVGPHGHVYAFDLQEQALDTTRQHLLAQGVPQNYTLICASHHRLKEFIPGRIKAGMFNLGYLPGGLEKGITTSRATTLPAVQAALDILEPDGILLVAVYPGHEEGRLEGEMLAAYAASLNRYQICATQIRILNSPSAPYFFIFEKAQDRPIRRPGRAAKNAARADRLAAEINAARQSLSASSEEGELP